MVIFITIGAILAILNVVLTYFELMPFFKAVAQLNSYTDTHKTLKNRVLYIFRFISLTPKLSPLLLDGGIAFICAFMGLDAGVMGALIGLTLGFTASLLVKIHRHWIRPRLNIDKSTWKLKED